MINLKTLTDLEIVDKKVYENGLVYSLISIQELRQEAIKWAKDMLEKRGDVDKLWLHFFNIMEADLK